MSKTVGFALLAAGKGTRLKIKTAKPLVPILGKKLIDFPLMTAENFLQENNYTGLIGVVVGHQKEAVIDHLGNEESKIERHYPIQHEQNGTAGALKAYFEQTPGAKEQDYTVVLCADTPLIRSFHLKEMMDLLLKENLEATVATFRTKMPKGYGRIVTKDSQRNGLKIVEEKDANDDQRKIDLVNSGLYIIKTSYALENLYAIDSNNASGEFYLTDLFKEEAAVRPVTFEQEWQFLGVNDLIQLNQAYHHLKQEKNMSLNREGVFLIDGRHTHIDWDVQIAAETMIYPSATILGKTKIGSNCLIEAGSHIKDSEIADNVEIKAHSYLESAQVKNSCAIGPFARLREGTVIGEECKIGNFVETKKVNLEKGVKVSHLSYVGDAEVGENVNIGCGFITCNYDGANKHKTIIGKNSFIGSDSQMIAPVKIGENAYVGSGSTINQDVPDGAFAIARARQVTKEGLARKFLKKKD